MINESDEHVDRINFEPECEHCGGLRDEHERNCVLMDWDFSGVAKSVDAPVMV